MFYHLFYHVLPFSESGKTFGVKMVLKTAKNGKKLFYHPKRRIVKTLINKGDYPYLLGIPFSDKVTPAGLFCGCGFPLFIGVPGDLRIKVVKQMTTLGGDFLLLPCLYVLNSDLD